MAVEKSELAALGESIAEVVTSECDSRKLHDFVDGKNDLDKRMWRQAAELGWLGVAIPESHGGLELGIEGLAVLHEKLGTRLVPGPWISTLAAARWIQACGDEATQKRTLGPIAEGKLSIAVPATIAAPRLQLAGGAVKGRSETLLGVADAGYALLPVKDGAQTAWALVEIDGRAARVTTRRPWDPTRSLGELETDGAKAVAVVKSPAAGAKLAHEISLAVTCDSVGAAGVIYRQTIDYQQTRVQFERTLASFQALKHRAANMHIQYETARHMAAHAAANAEGPDADIWPRLCKASVTDAFAFIAAECVQLHGGVGFTWEFDCHLYLKRARLNQALVGSNETQIDTAFDAMIASMKEGRSNLEILL